MPDRFNNVSEQIYRGGEPSVSDIKMLSSLFNIKRIISLDGMIGNKISPLVKKLGIEHIIIPIGGQESIPLLNYLKNNIKTLLNVQPVYIHCRHGSDRTGMAIALYRMQAENWSFEKAFNEANKYGFGNKLDIDTEDLYKSVLNIEDSNAAYDGRESFAPMEAIPMESKEPLFNDVPPGFKDPYAFTLFNPNAPSDEERKYRKLRKEIFNEILETVPQVGAGDSKGIRGAGPLAGDDTTGGGFVDSEGLGGGFGAGSIETGGLLNI